MSLQTWSVCLDGEIIEVSEGDNLLSSLLSHGADIRYSCRAGACGVCRLFDREHGGSILSCQTSVMSDLSLSVQLPFLFTDFSLLHSKILSTDAVALTLLGPNNDSFGDRVNVGVPIVDDVGVLIEAGDWSFECMAVNAAGDDLTIVLQKALLPTEVWLFILSLRPTDTLPVSSVSGVRKGRLLYEFGLDDQPVVVISAANNQVFDAYWSKALASVSDQYLGHYSLLNMLDSHASLEDEGVTEFLKMAQAEAGGAALHIIYHGQHICENSWRQVLRSLRIRVDQLHFVR